MPPTTVLTLPFPSPPHSHDFPGILFHNYHPSLLQLSNSHTCFHAPLSILNPHVCRAIQLPPAALLIRPSCTPVNISFSRIPCPIFKNYFHFLSKGLLSPFHVPGPDLGPKTPSPRPKFLCCTHTPKLRQSRARCCAGPSRAFTDYQQVISSHSRPTAPLSCSSRAPHSGAVTPKRWVRGPAPLQGLREGAVFGERAQGPRGGGRANGREVREQGGEGMPGAGNPGQEREWKRHGGAGSCLSRQFGVTSAWSTVTVNLEEAKGGGETVA